MKNSKVLQNVCFYLNYEENNKYTISVLRRNMVWDNSSKKQQPEVFCKKRCSYKFHKIHRKTPEACNFIKKESLAQVISCEFCEISKTTFFTEHLWATVSVFYSFKWTYRGSDITKQRQIMKVIVNKTMKARRKKKIPIFRSWT